MRTKSSQSYRKKDVRQLHPQIISANYFSCSGKEKRLDASMNGICVTRLSRTACRMWFVYRSFSIHTMGSLAHSGSLDATNNGVLGEYGKCGVGGACRASCSRWGRIGSAWVWGMDLGGDRIFEYEREFSIYQCAFFPTGRRS